ncbi:MAG: DNA polymerase [Pseudomonadota bacterium]
MNTKENKLSIGGALISENTGIPVTSSVYQALKSIGTGNRPVTRYPVAQTSPTQTRFPRTTITTENEIKAEEWPENHLLVSFPELFEFLMTSISCSDEIFLGFRPRNAKMDGTTKVSVTTHYLQVGFPKDNVFVLDMLEPFGDIAELQSLLTQKKIILMNAQENLTQLESFFGKPLDLSDCFDISTSLELIWFATKAIGDAPEKTVKDRTKFLAHIMGTLGLSFSPVDQPLELFQAVRGMIKDVFSTNNWSWIESLFALELHQIQKAGIPIARETLEQRLTQLTDAMAPILQSLEKAGIDKTGSYDQVRGYFQKKEIALEGFKNQDLERVEDEVARMILQIRKLKPNRDFLMSLLEQSGPCIHTHFRQIAMPSGRMSAESPNVQGIPKKMKKEFYKAMPGRAIIHADVPATQLRFLAALTQDKELIECFRSNQDPHTLTAAKILGIDIEKVSEEDRQKGKVTNFSIAFGTSASSFQETAAVDYKINFSIEQCEEFIANFKRGYPGIAQWQNDIRSKISVSKEKGKDSDGRMDRVITVKSLGGRVIKAVGYNASLNYPISGSEADMLKMATLWFRGLVRDCLIDAQIINLTHDDIVVECALKDIDAASAFLKRALEHSMNSLIKDFQTKVKIEKLSLGSEAV